MQQGVARRELPQILVVAAADDLIGAREGVNERERVGRERESRKRESRGRTGRGLGRGSGQTGAIYGAIWRPYGGYFRGEMGIRWGRTPATGISLIGPPNDDIGAI